MDRIELIASRDIGEATARRQAVLLLGQGKIGLGNGLQQFFAPGGGCLRAGRRQENSQAVFAECGGEFILAAARANQVGELPDELLRSAATEAIDETVEVIQIEDGQPTGQTLGGLQPTMRLGQ